MKSKFVIGIVLLICFTVPAWAADFPKAEVFGGFSVLSLKIDENRETPLGWQASIAGNPSKVFGIVGDFGGQYKTVTFGSGTGAVSAKVKIHEYLFGPQFSARTDKVTAFAHALYGGVHFTAEGLDSENDFAMGYGGGLDVKAGKASIRVVQVDWIPVRTTDNGVKHWEKSPVRFGFGFVFPLGK
jgi:hypothetical protein